MTNVSGLGARDWTAIYAALLSTATATVQVVHAIRDRSRLRLRLSFPSKAVTDDPEFDPSNDQHVVVEVANVGPRTVTVYPPVLEVVPCAGPRIRNAWAHETLEDDFHWTIIEDYNDVLQLLDLKESRRVLYRFTIREGDHVVRATVSDGAGRVRAQKTTFLGTSHALVFRLLSLRPKARTKRESRGKG